MDRAWDLEQILNLELGLSNLRNKTIMSPVKVECQKKGEYLWHMDDPYKIWNLVILKKLCIFFFYLKFSLTMCPVFYLVTLS